MKNKQKKTGEKSLSSQAINVTKTYLPNKKKYKEYVDEIYENGWITNNGPLVQKLEKKLAKYLGVKNIVLVANGTVALEIAYRILELKGFAITTPFSFVATTSSLVTNQLLPIFADINPKSLNIDPKKIEKQITKNTSAIVATHVFGNPCDVEAIEEIAKKYKLKVVYDGAHTFDVKYKNTSVLNYGDISTLSFHATKLFHTIEGGALIINDDELVEKARYLINFGIKNQEEIPHLGTNAKMNEFEAAMGLCVLDDIEEIKEKRKVILENYRKELKGLVQFQEQNTNTIQNYSYFPIIFDNQEQLLKVQKALNEKNIFPRRYFYPSLDTLDYIEPKQECKISRDMSKRILCLPIYAELRKDIQNKIINTIKDKLK
ncbi:DegT/DnrJ/EryC1/StrS family aminotransferase [Aliarcobacter skirrowii]|uniref:DegT/DnrJ/EryC1/StrS family aminotransferase n=1 Tax=Aliarcobacter skirrowii TaxID=28200 RepID=UPI0029BFA545|nr:DegT/DnrJ/EryC1/StrS family aminotransferase [Aliarcobacter skirrowii]MDX3960463.1 DegT/DnrJ/EryC1/StrS family aminotransferase [Aliarcobacter skirrowii]